MMMKQKLMERKMTDVGCDPEAVLEERTAAQESLALRIRAVSKALEENPKDARLVRILCRHVQRTVRTHLTCSVRRLRPWYSDPELLRVLGKTFEQFFETVVSEVCEGPLRFEQRSDHAGYMVDLVEKCFFANLDWGRSLNEQTGPPVPPPQLRSARYIEGFFREVHKMEEEPGDLLYLRVGLGFSKDEVSRVLDLPMEAVELGIESATQRLRECAGA